MLLNPSKRSEVIVKHGRDCGTTSKDIVISQGEMAIADKDFIANPQALYI